MDKIIFSQLKQICLFYVVSSLLLQGSCIFSQEEEGMHHKWLVTQRQYPADSIDDDVYLLASEHQALNNSAVGFYITDPWTGIGPFISGSGAGRVTSVRFDPDYDSENRPYLYLTGHNGGVWKSTNNGASFFPISDALPSQSSGVVCIDPNNHNTIYYATGGSVEAFMYNYYGLGVFKSTDGGSTWTGGNNVNYNKGTHSYAIVVNPSNSNQIFLAERVAFFISTDAGVTWNAPYGSGACTDVSTSADGQIICAIGGPNGMYWPPIYPGLGYYRSTDYGSSFQPMSNYGFSLESRTHISVSHANKDYVYAVTRSGGYVYAYTSTDKGVTFPTSFNLNHCGSECYPNPCCGDFGLMSADFLFVEASPHDQSTAIIGFGTARSLGLWKTTNAGVTWTEMNNAPGADHNCFNFNPNVQNDVLIGYDQGAARSTNLGGSWDYLNSSLTLTENYRITSYYDANVNLVLGAVTDGGFTRTTDGGSTWQSLSFGCDGTNVVFSQLDPNPNWSQKHVVASKGACSQFLYSVDGGYSYYGSDLAGTWDGAQDWIAAYTEDPYLPGIFFCPLRDAEPNKDFININLSTNYGQNWFQTRTNHLFDPIFTNNVCQSPQTFTMSAVDTNLLFVSTIDMMPVEVGCLHEGPRLFRSTNAGQDWTEIGGLADRYISSIITDPVQANIVYATVSGFKSGHVFKSFNGGLNWFDISGEGITALPDVPVNCAYVRYISSIYKEIIVGTDNGIYVTVDEDVTVPPQQLNYSWQEYASSLPRTIILDIDINEALGKIRCAAFGRSIFENVVNSPWVIAGSQNIVKGASDLNINEDIVVASNGILNIPSGCTIRMKEGTKITVQDSGKINISGDDPVYFTSQSGSWGGIEIQDHGYGTLKNCVFSNTETPITINCTVKNVNDLSIEYCTFSGGSIISSGRDNVYIHNNTVNSPSQTTGTAISVIYGENIVINKNTIRNSNIGISISNSDPAVLENTIEHDQQVTVNMGISADNSYGAIIKYNTVTDYPVGIYLNSSSPVMYCNAFTGVSQTSTSLYAEYNSSPRLRPYDDGGEVIWDAGKDTLDAVNNYSNNNTIFIHSNSIPDLDGGCNVINSSGYSINGDIEECFMSYYDFYARNNTWNSFSENVCDAGYYIDPTGCGQGQGGGKRGDEKIKDPPPPIIINYGHGIYDTIKITLRNFPVSNDNLLYSQAMENELQGNFQQAITKYQQIITNYQDSITASNSLKRLIHCYEKMNANSLQFSGLRSFYQGLVQANPTDTGFVNIAEELAAKCLVKMGTLPDAITAYEGIVLSSNDSLKILCAELNIIETYMIMQQGGMAKSFTGKIQALKPVSLLDGIKMINEKLRRFSNIKKDKLIPKEFSLSQNYPNPFNPITKINYALPQKSNVTIKVFDILGRLVKTVVNEFKDAGYYTVTFDGTGLASGVYFYIIEAGNYNASKKMVLVK